MKDLYTENYKMLMKEIKDINKCKYILCSYVGKIIKMFVLPKAIYWLSEISINITVAYFTRKQILKFLWNHKTTWIVKIILKKNKAGAITLIDFKLQLTLERCRGWETQLKLHNLSFALYIHCSSTSAESTNLELCSTVVFTTEKTNKKQKHV